MDEYSLINSIIGPDSEFKGEFKVSGVLRIDGTFTGELKTSGKILIGKSGIVNNDIHAGNVVIGGTVNGNVFATEQVTILTTGHLNGNVITPSLVVEEGVNFEGNCIIDKSIKDDPNKIKAIRQKLINSIKKSMEK